MATDFSILIQLKGFTFDEFNTLRRVPKRKSVFVDKSLTQNIVSFQTSPSPKLDPHRKAVSSRLSKHNNWEQFLFTDMRVDCDCIEANNLKLNKHTMCNFRRSLDSCYVGTSAKQ